MDDGCSTGPSGCVVDVVDVECEVEVPVPVEDVEVKPGRIVELQYPVGKMYGVRFVAGLTRYWWSGVHWRLW